MMMVTALKDPMPIAPPETESGRAVIYSGWNIIRCQPNMEIIAAESLRERGFDAFCPAEYRAVRTNKVENGRRVRALRPRAMITGYSFVRFAPGAWDFEGVRRAKGVGDFLRINGRPAGLTAAEVARIHLVHNEELERYHREMARLASEDAARASGKPSVPFEAGKQVLVDGPTGEPWIATMLQERGARRVQVMVDNAKIIVEHHRIHEIEVAAV